MLYQEMQPENLLRKEEAKHKLCAETLMSSGPELMSDGQKDSGEVFCGGFIF